MKNALIRYVFDKKRKASLTETGLLQIEVRIKGTNKSTYISTHIKLLKNQFSDKNGFTCVKHEKANMITLRAREIFNQIEDFVFSEKCLQLSDAKNWDKEESFTLSIEKFINEDMKKRRVSLAVADANRYLINQLNGFGKIKTFDDINYTNIVDFDAYLRKTISSQPTLYKKHSRLKGYIVKAINMGLCKENPYLNFKVVKGKSKAPTFLTSEEVAEIEKYTPTSERLEKVKDLFIFQCFTGLAFIDMINFDKSLLSEMEGKTVIRSRREKTDESFISLLLPQAKAILEKYDYQLPKMSNQKYNDYLKLVGTGAKLTKDLTSHVARHTFATYLINNNIPIESVSKALGHSSVRQTAWYANLLGKTVIKDMEKLLVPEKKSTAQSDA